MNKELEEKLYKDFPLLYSEHKLPMSHTCMCWGFSHGDGWYNLIYELSSKLEQMIKKEMKKVKAEDKVCVCGCKLSDHIQDVYKNVYKPVCNSIFKIPYQPFKNIWYIIPNSKILEIYKSIIQRFQIWINAFCYFISPVIYKNIPCRCNGYEEYHATASQVKEKFGVLHFYTNGFTDKMNKLVDEAEKASETICEFCGKPGKRRNNGWIQTLCNKCHKKNEKEKDME